MYFFNEQILGELKQTDFSIKKVCLEEIQEVRRNTYTELIK